MTATTPDLSLYRLMTWLSPGYPVGSFSYSHGLEYAVDAGLVRDGDDVADWVAGLIRSGAGIVDGALLAAAWHAAAGEDVDALDEVLALAAAWRGTAETALESTAQGEAFLATTRRAWPHPLLEHCASRAEQVQVAHPVAVGVAAAAHELPLEPTVTAYLHGFVSTVVSAAVRVVPLGQTEGQRILAHLEPVVTATVQEVLTTPIDFIGSAALTVDLCSIHHETQYTRLFRS